MFENVKNLLEIPEMKQKTEKMFFAVNVLTNTPNISRLTKGDTFQIVSPQSDGKIL